MKPAQRWTLIAAVLGSGIVFLDSTVVNVALPRIGRELPTPDEARLASADAIQVAMLIGAALLLAGAVVNLVGLRRQAA